ncbi:MAG: 2-oxoglutarate oxidoreductase [Candidatus Sericytochromatia bacterium]|nr:2-oxoglutarate oxidoreductase [Candidatus Sericytochromatia bacterium]
MAKINTLLDTPFAFCPGCSHGVVHRLIAGAIDQKGWREQAIAVAGAGCANRLDTYWDLDVVEAPYGMATAVATGIKRVHPDRLVIAYMGDGDAAGAGLAELMQAATRGEKLTVIMVNNLTLGLSGGHLSPTTLVGQPSISSPYGRSIESAGHPLRVTEAFGRMPGAPYSCRVAVDTADHVEDAVTAVQEALHYQMIGKGFSFVEIMGICPPGWNQTPQEATEYLKDKVLAEHPLGLRKRSTTR